MKSKGSASTRVLAIMMLIVAIAGLCYAAYVPTDITYEIASNPEMLAQYLRDVTGTMISDSYLFTPTDGATPPPLADGRVWYNNTADRLQISLNGTTWTNIDVSGGNSLDAAYDLNHAVTVDGTAITLTVPDSANNSGLTIAMNDSTTGDLPALVLTSAADAGTAIIDIQGTAGYDIQGTGDLWEVSVAGIGDFTGLIVGATSIVLENAETIINDTDREIQFGCNSANAEDISFVFGDNDGIIGLDTDTAATIFEFGVFNDVNGVENIIFDSEAGSIVLDGNAAAADFTIEQTADAGTQDASLVLNSDGTADDALIITAMTAGGGIDVDATGSIVITSAENQADAIVIQATTGGIDILCDAAGAGQDIDIANTAGSVNISATEDDAGAITLTTNGGNTETIVITNTQGAGVDAITIVGTAGGIAVDAIDDIIITVASTVAADDLALVQTGGVNASITMAAAGTGVDAIDFYASAGGIDIDAALGITIDNAGAASDIEVTSALGSIVLTATEDAALDAIVINATGAVSGIDMDTTNGPIVLTAANVGNGDITLEAANLMNLSSVDHKVFGGAVTEIWEITGTVAGDFEHLISFTDATADITWTFPTGGADTIAIMGSTLATNYPEIANSVTGGTNQLIFEGAGVDDHEAIITATDPTGDVIWILPDIGTGAADSLAVMGSTFTTNYPEIIDSVWCAANQIRFEGATADGFESVITSADITGGVVTWTLADMGAADVLSVLGSTLTTNAVGIANSIWGTSNALTFEGVTDDIHQTSITPTDPTATNTLTLPDDTGYFGYIADGGTANLANAGAVPLTDAVVLWSSTGADAGTLPDGASTGQIITVIVVAQAGGACTLTPDSVTGCGFATVVFTNIGESATFMYIDATIGWMCIGTAGVSTQPLLTQ